MESPSWWMRALVGRRPARTAVRLLVLVVLALGLFKWPLLGIRVTGRSMEPTYHDRRILFISQIAYRWHPPQRGDIVGLQAEGSRLVILKRIVGLPGERVLVWRGRVYVNGEPLSEPYLEPSAGGRPVDSPPGGGPELTELGPDEYYAIGDNRPVTAHGKVKNSQIRGKVVF
jgi:signal peptidase I